MHTWLCLITVLFLIAGTVYASVNLPVTGQTASYAAGDDGEIRAGLSWPMPRYTDHGNGSALDNLTGLIWTTEANVMAARDPVFDTDSTFGDGRVTFQHALDYVAKLNDELYLGYGDWRLPNRRELMSLIDFSRSSPTLTLYHPFTIVESAPYWTSTTCSQATSRAWTVNLYDGMMLYQSKSETSGYVWPVRTGP